MNKFFKTLMCVFAFVFFFGGDLHAGRLDPETGFYYMRNRYYSPETGRYIQPDPNGVLVNASSQHRMAQGKAIFARHMTVDHSALAVALGVGNWAHGNGNTYSAYDEDPWNNSDPLGLKTLTYKSISWLSGDINFEGQCPKNQHPEIARQDFTATWNAALKHAQDHFRRDKSITKWMREKNISLIQDLLNETTKSSVDDRPNPVVIRWDDDAAKAHCSGAKFKRHADFTTFGSVKAAFTFSHVAKNKISDYLKANAKLDYECKPCKTACDDSSLSGGVDLQR